MTTHPRIAEAGDPVLGFAPSDVASLFAALDHCVLVHDARTKDILWANPAACSALGFTLEELLPLKAADMSSHAPPYGREIGRAWLQRAVDEGTSVVEWCYRSKAGTELLSEARAVRVDLERGPVVMVQFRDIAEEKAVRADLYRIEGRLQAFLRYLDEGIVVLDDDGHVQFAGESAGALLGRGAEEITGTDFTACLADESAAVLRDALASAPRDDQRAEARYRLSVPGDAGAPERWFAARCRYIDIENDLRGLLLLFHDITEAVRTEERHLRDTQYLNHLARFNAMGDMAMAIAHEVSQPIAAAGNFVAGVSGRLGGDPAGTHLRWGLDHANRQLERAGQILQSLRAYVFRLEESKQRADLNDIVADCAYFIDLRARQQSVALEWQCTEEELPVHCEKVLIGQVVTNLAFNAIEEMAQQPEEERTVSVETRLRDGCAEVEVRDTGQGLPVAEEERIFDGMFSSKGDGHGIGLALSHRIITRHEGEIEAGANSPRGAVFRFRLPLHRQGYPLDGPSDPRLSSRGGPA